MDTTKKQDEKFEKILNIFEDEVHKKLSGFFYPLFRDIQLNMK